MSAVVRAFRQTPRHGPSPRNLKQRLDRAIAGYLAVAERHSAAVLVAALLLAGLGVLVGQRIAVNPSLEALLPKNTRALPALDELRRRVPGSSPLYLLVSSDDPSLSRRLAVEMLAGVKAWPETLHALGQRDPTFFLDRQLLFLPAKSLDELADTIEELVEFEECERVPGCVNLDDRPEPPDQEALRRQLASQPEVRALLGLVGMKELPERGSDTGGDDRATDAPAGAPRAKGQGTTGRDPQENGLPGQLCSPDGKVCAVHVVLDGTPSDLTFAQAILDKSEALFARIRPPDAPSSLRMATSGPYRNAPMTKKVVVSDLRNTASLSTGLMLALVLLQFRFGRAFILIFVPLLVAAGWSAGLIALLSPELNVISAFTLAVLAGLGIDFGVHMLTHYGTERARGVGVADALDHTFAHLSGPMAVAGVTTACGFGALLAADFRGFAQMGGLAAVGVAMALLAFLLLFPALAHLCQRISPEQKSPVRVLRLRPPALGHPRRLAWAVAGGGLVLAALLAVVGSRVAFEHNFRNLRPKTVSHGIDWGKAMHGTTRSAVVMMADARKPLTEVAETLRAEGGGDLVKSDDPWIITADSFIPKDQDARLSAIARIRQALERGLPRLSEEEQADLAGFRSLLDVRDPIRPDKLPAWVDSWLRDSDGRFGTFGLIYTDLSGADAHQMELLAGKIETWHRRFPEVLFASGVALLGLVVPGLRADAPTMLGLAIGGLLLSTWLISRSFRRALLVLSPIVMAMALTLAVMVAIDLRVNMYNMLIFPLAFGIGVDGAVYVAWVMSRAQPSLAEFGTTARGVLGSTLTTTAGFGSMVVAQNPGLVSLGALAIISLSAALVANLVWLPAAMLAFKGRAVAAGGRPAASHSEVGP